MKRFGWLVLLVSLGLNLGLGWRLFSEARSRPGSEVSQRGLGGGDHPLRTGRHGGEGKSGRGLSWERRSDFFRPAPGDSGAWCKIMEHRLERITEKLELDPEQVKSFRATQRDAAARFRDQRRLVEAAEGRLHALAATSAVQPDSIRAAVRELSARKALLDSLVTETMLRELESLSTEQRERYLQILPWSRSGAGGDGRRAGGQPHGKLEPPCALEGE